MRLLQLSLLSLLGLLVGVQAFPGARPETAGAAFPGANGKIAFHRNFYDMYVVNEDGSGETLLIDFGGEPA